MKNISTCDLNSAIRMAIMDNKKIRPITWRKTEEKLKINIIGEIKYPYVMYLAIEPNDSKNGFRFVKYTYKDNNRILNCHFNPEDLVCDWEILDD